MKIALNLPLPPSTNRIWRSGKSKSGKVVVYRDKKYLAWQKAAGWSLAEQKISLFVPKPINKPYRMTLEVAARGDVDNRIKAIGDLLQSMGVVVNDSLCESVLAKKVTKEEAPTGCRIILETD